MTTRSSLTNENRRGVTLVEMLVVVALTVLLMSIVAEVFSLASETLSQLRILSNMNQDVRRVEATLRLDLENRSIREVGPPVERFPGLDGITGTGDDFFVPVGIDPKDNLGYFTYEENSPADEQGEDTDDVIAWTVRSSVGYSGRVVVNSEPDRGDGRADGLATSPEAEIIWFLHEGNLYRRVLLVGVAQPSALFNPGATASWYAQYDVSARPNQIAFETPIVNTLGDLTYRSARYGAIPPASYGAFGLAADVPEDPRWPFLPLLSYEDVNGNRFHDNIDPTIILDHNNNYPYQDGNYPAALASTEEFIGRPSIRETSSLSWDYPNNLLSNVWANYHTPGSGQSHEELFDSGVRPSDDIILSNVLSFDVKAWDPDATATPARVVQVEVTAGRSLAQLPGGAYVDLGKFTPHGILGAGPPERAGGAGPDVAGNSINGPNASLGTPFSLPGCDPTAQQVITPVPLPPPLYALGPNLLPYSSPTPRPGVWPPVRPALFPFFENNFGPPTNVVAGYRRGFATPFGVVDNSGIGLSRPRTTQQGELNAIPPVPSFPTGMVVSPPSLWRTYDTWCSAYTKRIWNDANGDGIADSGESLPVAPPYMVPLRGIQIKIRFVDADSGRTREMTITQELQ